jgi:hypothetical protein
MTHAFPQGHDEINRKWSAPSRAVFFDPAGLLALIAQSMISTVVPFGARRVTAVASETLAVLPAPALLIVCAPSGYGLAEIAIFREHFD